MIYPEFFNDICVSASEDIFHLVLLEKCVKPLNLLGLKVEIIDFEKGKLVPNGNFLYGTSWYHFFINEEFLLNHYNLKTDSFYAFTTALSDIFQMSANIYDSADLDTGRTAMFSFYMSDKKNIYLFPLNNQTIEVLNKKTKGIFETMQSLLAGDNQMHNDNISKAYVLDDQVYYLNYIDNRWQIIDPLNVVADQFNLEYKKNTDGRVNKPDIVLHAENLSKKFTFSDNWVLKFDGLSIVMIRPNDVSIYASICERNLKEAVAFYNKKILPQHEYNLFGLFPAIEQQKEYYDYFELITTALIFAYTALEAFINSVIPEDYTYTTTEGTIHNKEKIERNYTLTKKLTRVLKELLNTPDPERELWWANLQTLQDIRDETIHTKQSRSSERYSKLLQKDIFDLVKVYKTIIIYYGEFMYRNAPNLLNIYPYDFGYDQVSPSLMTDGTYRSIYNDLHNPSNPL